MKWSHSACPEGVVLPQLNRGSLVQDVMFNCKFIKVTHYANALYIISINISDRQQHQFQTKIFDFVDIDSEENVLQGSIRDVT